MDLLTTIASNMRERRRELGLSQEEVAERMGVKRQFYGQLESGNNNFSINTLERILSALEIGIMELLKEREQNG